MHFIKNLRMIRASALVASLFASGALLAAEPPPAAQQEAIAGERPASEAAATGCHFGICKEASFIQPRTETIVGSDVLPMRSPAQWSTDEEEPQC